MFGGGKYFVQEEEQRRKRFGHGGEEERKMKRSKIFGEVKLMVTPTTDDHLTR